MNRLFAAPFRPLISVPVRNIGKTELGHKWKTPKLRLRSIKPIFPPPGFNLEAPEELTPTDFFRQIGGDCEEYGDKFESMDQILSMSSLELKNAGLPTQ